MSKSLRGSLILLLTAFIWGFAFVAQSKGMENIGPFTFQFSRMLLAVLVLVPTALINDAVKKKKAPSSQKEPFLSKKLVLVGCTCGLFLFIASSFQQVGILYTSVGHAGFLTALYVLMVPIIGLFAGKKVGAKLWFCIIIAVVGLYLLCMTGEGFSLSKGDVLVLICALFFSFQILAVEKLASPFDGIKISAIQMLTAGLLSLICAFIFEEPSVESILSASGSIAYAGILSCGVAYTLQIIGQRHTPAAVASIIMSLESVFAVLGGAMLLSQIPSASEIFGCILMLSATVIAQLPERKFGRHKKVTTDSSDTV